jgi:hypothetical protein
MTGWKMYRCCGIEIPFKFTGRVNHFYGKFSHMQPAAEHLGNNICFIVSRDKYYDVMREADSGKGHADAPGL